MVDGAVENFYDLPFNRVVDFAENSVQLYNKMESERKKSIQKNSQLRADDIVEEIIPLEHNEKRAGKQTSHGSNPHQLPTWST